LRAFFARRFLAVFFLAGLGHLALISTIHAQSRIPHSRFIIQQWGVNDGLPVNNVMKLHQSRKGYLWMATLDGLVRFDGNQFKTYQTVDYPGLPSNRLVKLHEGPDGSIWMVSEQRYLIRFQDNQFTHIQQADELNGSLVYDMHLNDNGYLWFATDQGISFFDGQELKPFHPELIRGTLDRVYADKTGAVWYRFQNSLENYRFDRGQSDYIFTSPNSFHFNPVLEGEDGSIWFSSLDGMYRFAEESLIYCCSTPEFLDDQTNPPISLSLPSDSRAKQVNFSFVNNVGRFFTAESGEKSTLLDETFRVNSSENQWEFTRNIVRHNGEIVITTESFITSTLFDNEGNLWVATSAEGLFFIKPNPFQTWGREEGLPGQNVYPIIEDNEGVIWVGTFGQGIARISDNRAEQIPGSEGTVLSLFQHSDGTLFAGYFNQGYYAYDKSDGRFIHQKEPSEVFSSDIYAMHEQSNGNFWLGTSSGLFLKQNNEWRSIGSQSGLEDAIVRFFLNGPDDSLWMATNGAGIARYKDNKITVYGLGNGLGSNLIRSLFIEPESGPDSYVLWAGSEDQGLFRLEIENGEPRLQDITQYRPSDGLLDHVIHIILMDDDENFWFNTNRGVFKVAKEELEAFHRGEASSVQGIVFTENDGLRNREGNGGMQPAGFRASDGTIWLPGQGGVKRFDPENIFTNEVVPPILIEEVQTADKIFYTENNGELQFSRNIRDFEFRFSSLSFVEPAKNEFKYRLMGYNEDWIEAGNRRTATYTNIPAGNYTFEVMGSNNAGVWNPEPASIHILIAPYFYETRWFPVLLFISAVLLIYGGIRLRVRSLEKTEKALKQLVEDKTMQLQKEKEITEMQAEKLKELDMAKTRFFTNMSHEFRTPLTLIIGPLQRMLTDGPEKYQPPARQELDRMFRNSKRLLRLMDQTLELTKLEQGKLKLRVQEIDVNIFLKELVDLFMPLCEEKEIRLTYIENKTVDSLFADPYKLDKIIGNLISNAIKFTPAGGQITVKVLDDSENFFISVSDTGIGISNEHLDKIFERFFQVDSSETRFHEGSGIGLSLAREFAEIHHGELEVESTPSIGTTFTLTLKKGRSHYVDEELKLAEVEHFYAEMNDHVVTSESPAIDTASYEDQTKVLIVEDNGDVRAFVSEQLTDIYQVLEASNGIEALNIVGESLPDLIIADIMMPGMDGIAFNRELKKDASTASIPVVFLTAKSTRSNQLEGLQEGADDYITKPFDPSLLKARVSNLIESRMRLRRLLQINPQTIEKSDLPLISVLYDTPFLNKLRTILENHLSNPEFQVADFANELNLSRSYMTRKIKKETGLTPGELIKNYRLEKASVLLKEKSGNISEVAYAVGFNSLSYFSHSFKEHYDLTPSNYLKGSQDP
jgi:signal transduction histidine kinase/ligand-binding sensor domain-containing protein/DNA-binding response OmpR family regulator